MIYYITKQSSLFSNNEDITILNSLDMLHEYLSNTNNTLVACDTETTGFDPHTNSILCIQLGNEEKQFVLNLNEFDISEIAFYFEDSSKTFIFHNAKFDLRFLLSENIKVKNVKDTFLAELVLTTGYDASERENFNLGLDLDSIVTRYCDYKLDKSIRGNIHREGLTERVVRYAAEDVKFLHKILKAQEEKIETLGLTTVYELECNVTKVFALMEYTGVLINKDKWKDIASITEKESKTLGDTLDTDLIEKSKSNKSLLKFVNNQLDLFNSFNSKKTFVNWSSPAQKKEILTLCGLDMKDGVGDRELQRLKRENTLIPTMIEYSKMDKLASAFGKKFLKFVNPATDRIHYNVWQILTTGRISVSEPNLNQIPSKGELGSSIRSCFIPREGYKIVGGDFSGMELRIIAEFSQDELWINSFKNGEDLHSVLCSKTFDIPIENVKTPFPPKPNMTYRDVQKTINFGLAYGMSEFKLADTMQIPVEDAKTIINKFFSVVPKVAKFLEACSNYAKTKGYIKTPKPYSRMRFFGAWKKAIKNNDKKTIEAIGRAGKNTPIQGCNGDIIKKALIKTQEYIDTHNYPCFIILSVYDEIQTECREDKAEEWRKILNSIMIQSAEEVIKTVPIVVDCSISSFWRK